MTIQIHVPIDGSEAGCYRNDGYFFYHHDEELKTITQAVAFDFDKLETLGVTVADAFTALSKVVFGRSVVATKEFMALRDTITIMEPELPTYDTMRWWREGVEIEMKWRLFDYDFDYDDKDDDDDDEIPFGILAAALEYGPDILVPDQDYSITYY